MRPSAFPILCLLLAASAGAEPLQRDAVPAPLAPWVDWVLHDAGDAVCPFSHAAGDHRQCSWPSRLELQLGEAGGEFRQQWELYREAWVPLPGDAERWPQGVRVGSQSVAVVARGDVPSLRLRAGRHAVEGSFRWTRLPEFLRVPPETGLIALRLREKRVPFPERDREGRLWLQKGAEEQVVEARLEVTIQRRVVDEVPLRLDTRVELRVSGAGREAVLSRALPDHFVPLAIESPLPARLEADGRLRVQVRPGTWTLTLAARHAGPVAELGLPPVDGPWDPEEVWVFEGRNHLRLVHVEGVTAIDPQQTRLPAAWRNLPAYLMKPGDRMRLAEKRRGDADPAPDRLALERTWWLDFDGRGYTVHDEISGTLHRSWRLEMAAPTTLGRVAIDGRDQFLSRLDGERRGVEIRQGQVRVDADSRLDGVRSPIPAVGWAHDFQKVSGVLNLPPGWRLLWASGVDDVSDAWATGWSLLEIFLVLITALVVGQFWGWRWGLVALATLVLTYPETGSPRWSWLALLGAHALLRVAPEGNLRSAARLARLGTIALLAVIALPFAAQQVRQALYPALEFPWLAVRGGEIEKTEADRATSAKAPAGELNVLEEVADKARRRPEPSLLSSMPSRSHYLYADPAAQVSTGPGLPQWTWRSVRLSWRGPVEQTQPLRLVLTPPWVEFLLAWLRVGLLALLAVRLLDVGRDWLRVGRVGALTLIGVALLGGSASRPAAAAEFPSPELLDELRTRLLEAPECFPKCATIPHLRLEATPGRLRARVEIDVAWETAVPLPGGTGAWDPERVTVDGDAAGVLAHSPDGRLWIALSPGRHRVVMEGGLPERETLQLPLPLRPRRVEAQVEGWTLEGIREDGVPESSLQLTRTADRGDAARATLEPTELPPFVRVERRVQLGLTWQVATRVVRVSPPGQTVFLEVPLLAGESVTAEGIRVEDGHAQVSLAPHARETGWVSDLEPSDTLELRAPEGVPWVEVWIVEAGPIWHVTATGIPVVHEPQPLPLRLRRWQPWPGETVSLRTSRPAGVEGRTLTLDRSALEVEPGLRASEVTLELSLRASRGLQHRVGLPAGADLQSVEIDGERQPIRAVDGHVTLPIRPGKHAARLVWRSPSGIAMRYATPEADLGAPSVNAEIALKIPRDRWVLFVGGPRMGPAVLFWSLLLVAALVAVGLGRLPLTPLGTGSWFLLLVGLTQVPIWVSLIVAGWLVALGWRRDHARPASDAAFDGLQLLLALWTIVALLCLVWAIQRGLLGLPEMQIAGNGSRGHLLRWFQDRTEGTLPASWMVSVHLWFYRLAMLAWALWLARALAGWLRWGWQCFAQDGLWRRLRQPRITPA